MLFGMRISLLLLIWAVSAAAQSVVIRGAAVIDGTGAPARVADVRVEGGRIVAIGAGLTGDRVIDGTGKSLLPGLFDLHTHIAYSSIGGVPADWGENLKAYLRRGGTSGADFGTYGETFAPGRGLRAGGPLRGARVCFW